MNNRFFVLKMFILTFLFSCGNDNSTNPIDNSIETVKIGNQVWMLKNLNVDHYRNGDSIPEVRDSVEWVSLTTGAWCYYYNSDSLGKIYGKLYNWYAVNDPRGLAPNGFRIPTDDDWTNLTVNLGGANVSGGKMREKGKYHWNGDNADATNEFGFTALPGGFRNSDNITYESIGDNGYWWSSYINKDSVVFVRNIGNNSKFLWRKEGTMLNGYSVRCIRN